MLTTLGICPRSALIKALQAVLDRDPLNAQIDNQANPQPYEWTKTADQILASIARFAERTFNTHAAQHMSRTTGTGQVEAMDQLSSLSAP
jgi:hypothetical protein